MAVSKNPLQVVAESLQSTSRLLSSRQMQEMAAVQESVIQLIGLILLDGGQSKVVEEMTPREATEHATKIGLSGATAAAALNQVEMAAWVGSKTAHMVIVKSVRDDDEWNELPIFMQNFVNRAQMPCHLVAAVEQMDLEGDTRHRHVAKPVFLLMSRTPAGGLQPSFALGTEELRKQDRATVLTDAAFVMEPYVRILYAGIAQTMLVETPCPDPL